MATYFEITDVSRRHLEVNKQTDVRALAMDLKDSNVHSLVPGRTVTPAGLKRGKGTKVVAVVKDIFVEGKEVLELGAFRGWKDRTGKYDTDVFGCDPGSQHQREAAAEGQGVGEGVEMDGQGGDGDEVSVEFNPLADPELEGEI